MSSTTQDRLSSNLYNSWGGAVCCPGCESTFVYRVAREGLVRRRLLPLFRKYPWRCFDCDKVFMARAAKSMPMRRTL